jgi:hypothetical protein
MFLVFFVKVKEILKRIKIGELKTDFVSNDES